MTDKQISDAARKALNQIWSECLRHNPAFTELKAEIAEGIIQAAIDEEIVALKSALKTAEDTIKRISTCGDSTEHKIAGEYKPLLEEKK